MTEQELIASFDNKLFLQKDEAARSQRELQQKFEEQSAELAKTKRELENVRRELESIRITGPGFSGEGPRGISFQPVENPYGGSGGGAGVTEDFDFFDGDDGLLKVAHYTNGLLTSITT